MRNITPLYDVLPEKYTNVFQNYTLDSLREICYKVFKIRAENTVLFVWRDFTLLN